MRAGIGTASRKPLMTRKMLSPSIAIQLNTPLKGGPSDPSRTRAREETMSTVSGASGASGGVGAHQTEFTQFTVFTGITHITQFR